MQKNISHFRLAEKFDNRVNEDTINYFMEVYPYFEVIALEPSTNFLHPTFSLVLYILAVINITRNSRPLMHVADKDCIRSFSQEIQPK